MDKVKNLKVLLPVILFILLLLDGQISRVFRSVMTNQAFFNSHLLLIAITLASLWYEKRYMVITSVVVGLLFDVYYYGIVGINMVVLPLTVILIYVVFKHVPVNMLSIILGIIIFITIMDSSAYILQVIFNLRTPGVTRYVVDNLGPTLMFNIVLLLLLSWPINVLLKKCN